MFIPTREPWVQYRHQQGKGNDTISIASPLSQIAKGPWGGIKMVLAAVTIPICLLVLLVTAAVSPARMPTAIRVTVPLVVPVPLTVGATGGGTITSGDSTHGDVVLGSTPWVACGLWSLCALPSRVWSDHGDRFAEFAGAPGSWGVLRSCDLGASCELTNNSGNGRWCQTAGVPTLTKGRGPCPN